MDLQTEGLNLGGGGGGGGVLLKKKKRFETSHGNVDRNTFLVKSHNKATFSPVQYCHPAEGGGL